MVRRAPLAHHLPDLFCQRLKAIIPHLPEATLAHFFRGRQQRAFRINSLKIDPPAVKKSLKEQAIAFEEVPWYAPAFVLSQPEGALQTLVEQGQIYAQGLESMLAVIILDPKPGQRVLDLCAAPGSKTTQIAMHMNNEGALTANEPVRDRFYRLKSVVQLMGAKARLSMGDGRRLKAPEGFFDRILVDAPCSAEGRFCVEKPKSFAYWSERKIKEMAHKQKGLLLNASRLLAPDGVLVYATCTFAPEENEEVVDWLLRKTQGQLRVVDVSRWPTVNSYPCLTSWRGRTYDPQVSGALRVLPNERVEGFFIAKFTNYHYK